AAPKPQRMRGIGERLETVGTIPSAWIVLANPGVSVPTGAVFDAVADKSPPPGPNIPREGFTSFANLIAFLSVCRNDLQAAAVKICPAINTVLDALSGAPLVRMSGSGATCFALYPDQAAAEDKAAALHRSTDWWISSGAIQ
ncbi:MAG: 4-(cytidine 5'-diphospho)-2-C-methyl-D-erythritol kinase, partial [Pseudomonadota bacterium]